MEREVAAVERGTAGAPESRRWKTDTRVVTGRATRGAMVGRGALPCRPVPPNRPSPRVPVLLVPVLLVPVLLLVVLLAPAARGQEAAEAPEEPGVVIQVGNERPLRGESVRVTVLEGGQPLSGARVVAVYRPNSNTQHREELPPVDSSGLLLWTPTDAGPATLEVREPGVPLDADEPPVAAFTLAVRYGSFPPAGLFIMVLAGILLFGGATAGMILLMRPEEHMPAEEPPST